MDVVKGSTDISTYFTLRDSTNHAPKTDVTVTDIDLYYVSYKAAISAKADVTALAAADSAHADNKGFHVGQGLYRIDWPDIWAGDIGTPVQLIVVCTGVDTTFLEVNIVSPAQTGDSYAVVAHADYGNAKLVRSTTPANTLSVDANHLVAVPATQKVDMETIKTQAVTCAAGVTVLANVGFAGAPGANNGAPTTNGTKINQTVDLAAGQSIACSDKTGFSLSSTGADLILKSSTFVQAIVAAINELATYGLTALNTLLVTTGIKVASGTVTTVTNQLTAAQIATGVWQDATAGDFTTASSIGKALYVSNVVPGASGGHMISGSNAGTTTLGALTVTGATTLTGQVTATNASNDINGCNVQKIDDQSVTAAGGITVPATIASTTNITGGTITTVTNLTNAPTNGDLTAAMKSSVNAEVVDALATDTYAEPGQGAPAATLSLSAKIGYLFKSWRNKKTQTSDTFSLFADDAATVDQKATTSDNGTTTTITEITTGA